MTPMPTQDWVFRAKLVRIVDGDTQDIYFDAGFGGYQLQRVRLLGVNCPEVHGPSKPAGDAASAWVADWFRQGAALDEYPLVVQTAKTDDFGRYLATVWRVIDDACLNDDVVAAGHAVPFMV